MLIEEYRNEVILRLLTCNREGWGDGREIYGGSDGDGGGENDMGNIILIKYLYI